LEPGVLVCGGSPGVTEKHVLTSSVRLKAKTR
jgi:hypothetical protein